MIYTRVCSPEGDGDRRAPGRSTPSAATRRTQSTGAAPSGDRAGRRCSPACAAPGYVGAGGGDRGERVVAPTDRPTPARFPGPRGGRLPRAVGPLAGQLADALVGAVRAPGGRHHPPRRVLRGQRGGRAPRDPPGADTTYGAAFELCVSRALRLTGNQHCPCVTRCVGDVARKAGDTRFADAPDRTPNRPSAASRAAGQPHRQGRRERLLPPAVRDLRKLLAIERLTAQQEFLGRGRQRPVRQARPARNREGRSARRPTPAAPGGPRPRNRRHIPPRGSSASAASKPPSGSRAPNRSHRSETYNMGNDNLATQRG